MSKKDKNSDCWDCGSPDPTVKVAAYGGGAKRDQISNACGNCGQIWTKPWNQDDKKFIVTGFRGN